MALSTEEFIRDAAARNWSRTQTRQALDISRWKFAAILDAMPPLEWAAKGKSLGHLLSNESRRGSCTPGLRMAVERAIAARKSLHSHVVDGVRGSIEEHAERSSVSASTVRRRMKAGMSIQQALSTGPTPFAMRRAGFADAESAKSCRGFNYGI